MTAAGTWIIWIRIVQGLAALMYVMERVARRIESMTSWIQPLLITRGIVTPLSFIGLIGMSFTLNRRNITFDVLLAITQGVNLLLFMLYVEKLLQTAAVNDVIDGETSLSDLDWVAALNQLYGTHGTSVLIQFLEDANVILTLCLLTVVPYALATKPVTNYQPPGASKRGGSKFDMGAPTSPETS